MTSAADKLTDSVAAFIQCGGESRRLGRDKGSLPLGDTTCIERVIASARQVTQDIAVITNTPHAYRYLQLPVYRDIRPGLGPLGGIYTALHYSTSTWVLTLACDMPFVSSPLLTALLDRRADVNVVVPTDREGSLQPLCALYRRAIRPAVEECLDSGKRSVRDLLDRVTCRVVPFSEIEELPGSEFFFVDIDTPEDYERAQRIFEMLKRA